MRLFAAALVVATVAATAGGLAILVRRRRYFPDGIGRSAAAVLAAGTLLLGLAAWIASLQVTRLVRLEPRSVAGRYLFTGHDASDELVLSPDGTFSRTAVYRGFEQRQAGRWRSTERAPGALAGGVAWSEVAPPCLLAGPGGAGPLLPWRTPAQALCAGQSPPATEASFCGEGGRPALCFDPDGRQPFVRQ